MYSLLKIFFPASYEVESFDPSNGSWSETVAMNTPRVGGAAAVTGGAWKTWWGGC